MTDKIIFQGSVRAGKTAAIIATLTAERDRLRADAERLDALQKLTTGYGKGWMLRMSTTGRGLRLHETSQDGAVRDIREAIDNYINSILKEREAGK